MAKIPFAGHDPDEVPLHVPGRQGRNSTHCKRGHKFTTSNTYHVTIRGYSCRRCKQCLAAQAKARYESDPILREARKARAKRYWHEVRKFKCQASS